MARATLPPVLSIRRHGAVAGVVAKHGSGTLIRVINNDPTAAGTLSLYDALTETNPIASMAWSVHTAPTSIDYGIPFTTGLTYTTTGSGTDVTIVFE